MLWTSASLMPGFTRRMFAAVTFVFERSAAPEQPQTNTIDSRQAITMGGVPQCNENHRSTRRLSVIRLRSSSPTASFELGSRLLQRFLDPRFPLGNVRTTGRLALGRLLEKDERSS